MFLYVYDYWCWCHGRCCQRVICVSIFFFTYQATTEIYSSLFVGSVKCVKETGESVIRGGGSYLELREPTWQFGRDNTLAIAKYTRPLLQNVCPVEEFGVITAPNDSPYVRLHAPGLKIYLHTRAYYTTILVYYYTTILQYNNTTILRYYDTTILLY